MFEKIHFSKNYDRLTISSDEIQAQKERIGEAQADGLLSSDFYISGTVRSLSSIPMTEEKRRRFMFLQNFDYMNADSEYRAKQKGYRSYQILLTYSGEGKITYAGQNYRLKPGTVFLADCMNQREVRTAGTIWEFSDLHFTGGMADYLYANFFRNESPLFVPDSPSALQDILERLLLFHTTVSTTREWQVSSELENMLRFLLASDSRVSGAAPERIQYLVTYIENNFTRPLTMKELSDFACLSQYHLSREFKKYTGLSPYAYITSLRMQYAETLLRQTRIPSCKIAELVGIPDEAGFIRAFKLHFHMTPGAYRKSTVSA